MKKRMSKEEKIDSSIAYGVFSILLSLLFIPVGAFFILKMVESALLSIVFLVSIPLSYSIFVYIFIGVVVLNLWLAILSIKSYRSKTAYIALTLAILWCLIVLMFLL